MADKCPICESDVKEPTYYNSRGTSMHSYSCPRCGDFDLQYHFSSQLPNILNKDLRKIAVLSHWVRTRYEAIAKEPPDKNFYRKSITLDEQLVNSIIKNLPLTPAEQADNFIRWLGENIKYANQYIKLNKSSIHAIIGSINEEEFHFIIHHLTDRGVIYIHTPIDEGRSIYEVTLSFNGWERYEELKRGITDSRKAFMAMKYGDGQLDMIVENTFKVAVEQTGFDLFKLPDRPKAGLIDDRIRAEIQTSRFLIADLTHENRGAYWEAGYAEGLGKPVIYTCKKKKFKRLKTHFDTNHHLTILWDDVEPGKAGEELKATIRATLPEQAKLTDD